MKWFNEARYGMFIHWGLYAVPAGEWNGVTKYDEWIQLEAKIPCTEYDKLAAAIQPDEVRRQGVGEAREGRGHEVRRHHRQASRRLFACTTRS